MKIIILMCAICLQLGWSYGAARDAKGIGAFAYTDSNGQRYGGTYGLKDGQVTNVQGDYPGPYVTNQYLGLDDFFPEYFRNYENLLQESRSRRFIFPPLPPLPPLRPFRRNPLKTNRSPFSDFPGFAGFPALPTPPPFPSLPGFNMPMPMPNLGDNSAFAGAALTPGFSQQIAAISPGNPNNPNVNKVNRFADSASNPGGNFYSVSSSSFAKSTDMNGQQHTERGADTVVNKNGEVTSYRVRS